MQLSQTALRSMMQAFIDHTAAGARLCIYGGDAPADIEIPVDDQEELTIVALADPPFLIDTEEVKAELNALSYSTPELTGTPTFFIIYNGANDAVMMGQVLTETAYPVANALTMEGEEIVVDQPLDSVLLTIKY